MLALCLPPNTKYMTLANVCLIQSLCSCSQQSDRGERFQQHIPQREIMSPSKVKKKKLTCREARRKVSKWHKMPDTGSELMSQAGSSRSCSAEHPWLISPSTTIIRSTVKVQRNVTCRRECAKAERRKKTCTLHYGTLFNL